MYRTDHTKHRIKHGIECCNTGEAGTDYSTSLIKYIHDECQDHEPHRGQKQRYHAPTSTAVLADPWRHRQEGSVRFDMLARMEQQSISQALSIRA